MSIPRQRPRRKPVLFLWIAIGASLNAILGVIAALGRPDAGLLGWPSALTWALAAVLALWQWNRTVKAFRKAEHPDDPVTGAQPSQ